LENRQVILASRPAGIAQAANFEIRSAPMPEAGAGQLLVRNLFLSIEPAMRGWIADVGNYSQPVQIGSVMRSLAVAEVVASNVDGFAAGDQLVGWFGWQQYAAIAPTAVVRKITETDLPPSLALGVLGLNGITAYLALTKVGEPRAGETVLVSTAAGSVGSAVGQIAKLLGCRTVGIAGGPRKVQACLSDFGFDAAIDYRAPGLGDAIAAACPDGANVYFDNVAGSISDAVMPHLALYARIVVCGTASIDRWSPWPEGPRVERHLLLKRARMQGFIIFDHIAEYDAATATLADWVRAGKLTYLEDILDGIEACPDSIAGLYRGENDGKRLVRL
jgi:NADPH-dependent curcumin reductase CurA